MWVLEKHSFLAWGLPTTSHLGRWWWVANHPAPRTCWWIHGNSENGSNWYVTRNWFTTPGNKTGYSLCHSGKCGKGWVGGDWEVVKKGRRTFQHLSTSGHIARGKFGTWEDHVWSWEHPAQFCPLWKLMLCSLASSRRTQAPFKVWATGITGSA